MKKKKFKKIGIISQGVSEETKLFQVQIIHSRQLPNPRLGQLGLSKCGELFLSTCFMYFHSWADTSSRQASVVVHTIFMAQEVAENLKKQMYTHRGRCTHTQSESRKAVAKG